MFRLQTALNQADAFAARILAAPRVQKQRVKISANNMPVTQDCIPNRRRRERRHATTGASEPLRSTWF